MLSPVSGRGFTGADGGGLVCATGGVDVFTGSGWEVLQPAINANDNPVRAAATTLRFNENILDY